MSRFITKEDDEYLIEIDDRKVCKYMYDYVCCNDKSQYCADYPYYENCMSNKYCKYFEKEDGIINE